MRLFVTGHTGFKGGWLALYARLLGHEVHGYGLGRTTGPRFYDVARVRDILASEHRADVLDLPRLRQALRMVEPDAVLHLAARAIVPESMADPVGTIRTNVVGTASVLEAVRHTESVRATVIATTDKVYRNDGRPGNYDESAPLGGLDPYSGSKAAAEMIAGSYRHTFGLRVATARSGNAIGGGDWGERRLVPTCLDLLSRGERPTIYEATRPFFSVLDSVCGYLTLAERLAGDGGLAAAFNFGPAFAHSTYAVADHLTDRLGGSYERAGPPPHGEAANLSLSIGRAVDRLDWRPQWGLAEALDRTVDWWQAWREGSDMQLVTREQIAAHQKEAAVEVAA